MMGCANALTCFQQNVSQTNFCSSYCENLSYSTGVSVARNWQKAFLECEIETGMSSFRTVKAHQFGAFRYENMDCVIQDCKFVLFC